MNTPAEVIETAVAAARRKIALGNGNLTRLALLSVAAGAYIALGGALSLTVGYGFPGLTADNPALQKLLSGAMFPIGLILVVVLGAELFTGNNAVLIPGLCRGDFGMWAVIKNWAIVYAGNFVGAILFTYFLVDYCGLTASEPWSSAIRSIAEAKAGMPWGVVFVKGIGANWCVCLAVWLAMSGRTMPAKVIGCWIPVMAFVALGYEHSIANMFFIPAGMLRGADVGIMQAVTANLIPATLGNIAGGAILVGGLHTYLNRRQQQ